MTFDGWACLCVLAAQYMVDMQAHIDATNSYLYLLKVLLPRLGAFAWIYIGKRPCPASSPIIRKKPFIDNFPSVLGSHVLVC